MKKFFFLLILLSSCSRSYLYVQQENIDKSYLASSYVCTPDPRADYPPCGQKILLQWKYLRYFFDQELSFHVFVRFYDHSLERVDKKILCRSGTDSIYFPMEKSRGKILSYKIEVRNKNNKLIDQWTHKFWTKSIQIDAL